MIQVEGYKAFVGEMLITPLAPTTFPPFVKTGEWLYKPDTDCWYDGWKSYPADICTVTNDYTKGLFGE